MPPSISSTENLAQNFVDFMYFCNQLKLELRHCWFENGRRESVAEHSWQLALLAMTVTPYLSKPVCLETVMKISLIHDLVEIEAKDIPVFEQNSQTVKQQKFQRECQAMENIKARLPEPLSGDIHRLWHEYEAQQSDEAKVVKAFDKLEALIAHNVSDINTFKDIEKKAYEIPEWAETYCEIDPLLLAMVKIVNRDGIKKVQTAAQVADTNKEDTVS